MAMDQRMDTRIKGVYEIELGTEDSFAFHCTKCGKCCRDLGNILLTPKDMYDMARELGLSMADFFERNCETFLRNEIPAVKLKRRGPEQRCIFLKDGKCAVYAARPATCALYPIRRYVQPGGTQDFGGGVSDGRIRFYLAGTVCKDGKERHTVREWLEAAGIGLADEFFVEWHGFISRLNGFFCDLGKNTRTDMITLGQVLAFVGVYLSYDVGREFMPQFRKNTEETMRTLQEGIYGKCRGEDGLLRAIRNRFRVPSVLACN